MHVTMARGRGKKAEGGSIPPTGVGRGKSKGGVSAVPKQVGGITRASKRGKMSVKDVVDSSSVEIETAVNKSEKVMKPQVLLDQCNVSKHTAHSEKHTDECVPSVQPLSTTILYSTLGQHQARGVSESSSGSTVGTPAGSATPQSESAESSCDDSEQFSLASVLDKTRRVSSLSSTSSVVFNTSRDDDTNSPTDIAQTELKDTVPLELSERNNCEESSDAFTDEALKIPSVVDSNDITGAPKSRGRPKGGKNKPKNVASAIKEAMGKVFPKKQESSKKAKVKEAIREVFSPTVGNNKGKESVGHFEEQNDLSVEDVTNVSIEHDLDKEGHETELSGVQTLAKQANGICESERIEIMKGGIELSTTTKVESTLKTETAEKELLVGAISDPKPPLQTVKEITLEKDEPKPEASPVKPKYRDWTDAIWGPKDLSPKKSLTLPPAVSSVDNELKNDVTVDDVAPTPIQTCSMDIKGQADLKQDNKPVKVPRNSGSSKIRSSKRSTDQASANSTPSTTPRSVTPDKQMTVKKDRSKKSTGKSAKKVVKQRRRIQCGSDLDSEDSSVSTDSPLKPKTYTKPAETNQNISVEPPVTQSSKSSRIPKKKKENETEVKTEGVESPVEELPLIPKGFLEQKKKLEDTEAKIREIEAQEIAGTENAKSDQRDLELKEEERKMKELEDKREVEMKLKSFKHLTENHYLCARKVNKQSKKMQCDCSLSKEEVREGEKGCGDDCLNRLLYIECGKVCQLEGNCSNKRFQNNQNADIEVFKTDWKGFGIRARSYIPKDTFLMEYVGEVLDTKQFRKRAKQYSRDEVQHFYFMALSKDFYVDATSKGNISRFINHSCDPNAETQKWTVNGELRVGFFTKRGVKEGEELSFDYKFERYGNVAQKCYCGTSRCRGWLGGEPGSDSGIEEMDYWSSSEEEQEGLSKETMAVAEQERKKKKKKRPAKKIKNFEVDEYEEEVERLSGTGVRNKLQTVQLCRLMVRANMLSTRLKLAELLLEADQPCLRLFLDYQGLRILSHWMFELEWASVEMELKLRIEAVLASLSIPHKTMLVDSKVLQTVTRWSTDSPGGSQTAVGDEDSQPQSRTVSPSLSRAATPTQSQSRTSSPNAVIGRVDTESTQNEVVDMDIDEEHESEKQGEDSPSVEGEELFPPGEEPQSAPVLAHKTEEEEIKMPGCVDGGVSGVREGEAMVTGDEVLSVMKAQAGVAEEKQASAEVESEEMAEDKVEPVQREQLPLTEEEERKREETGGQITKVELTEEEKIVKEIQDKAKELLEMWSSLQEVFKIPKKERQAVRREHEMEADRSYGGWGGETYTDTPESRLAMLQANAKLYASMQSNPLHSQQERVPVQQHRGRLHNSGFRGYHESQGVMRGGYTGGRSAQAGPPARERRNLRLDDRTGRLSRSNLYRDDRRMLFQAKVEEEARQKVLRSAVAARHNQCCRLLGMDPSITPMLSNYPEFYLSAGKWIPMPPPPLPIDPSWTTPLMAALPPEAFKPGDPPLPHPRSIYPPGVCPEPPPSPQHASDHPTESYAEVCAYYDRLYYKAPTSPSSNLPSSTSPSPSPVPKKCRRSHSPSPFSRRLSSQISSNRSRPTTPTLLSPSQPFNLDLSPDYRSPSPVRRSPLVSPSYTSASNHTAPTSVSFLSSSLSTEEILPIREKSQLSHSLSTDAPLSPSVHSETQAMVHTQTHREGDAIIVKLPPKWKTARDSSGRVYYYHSVTRVTQWDPPTMEQEEEEEDWANGEHITSNHSVETADTDDEEDRSEEGEDTDTEDDSEEESEDMPENGGDNKEEAEDGEIPDSDLSASEKRMLMRMRGRTKEERTNIRRLKKERDRERREHERIFNRERHTRHRRDGLVEEHLVPARISEKDKADLMTFKEMRERLLNKDKIREQQLKEEKEEEDKERREERARLEKIRKEERRAANLAKRESEFRQLTGETESVAGVGIVTPESSQATPVKVTPQPSSSSETPSQATPVSSKKTTQAAADTSSDVEKKHKEKFVKEMSKTVVKILDPYRKKGVRGHIGNTDDFKHLAKKLTYSIMHKELKMCKSVEELKATEKVKKKASEYVSKYMKKYEREYKKSPEQDN